MSTDFVVKCENSAGDISELTIVDSIIPVPGSDTWESRPGEWDPVSGTVGSWGSGDAHLMCGMAAPCGILYGFTKSTNEGDTGDGDKNVPEGDFPMGAFKWICSSKD